MDIKNCLNFPDYTINTLGEVFNKHGLKLKIQYRPNGYGYIILRRDKTPYSVSLHRLVLQTFIGDEPTLVVNHKDFNKKNNCIENLEWCTQKENIRHAIENGKFSKTEDRLRNLGKERRQVFQYSLDNKLIRSYESTMEVERLTGVKSHYVVRCCLGGRPTAKGYKWSYERIGE